MGTGERRDLTSNGTSTGILRKVRHCRNAIEKVPQTDTRKGKRKDANFLRILRVRSYLLCCLDLATPGLMKAFIY